jgi:phage gpG-like protein
MIRFIYDIEDFKRIGRLSKSMDRGMKKLNEREDLMTKLKSRQIKRWEANFNTQGSLYTRWEKLAPSTLRNRGRSAQTLYDTGGLYKHFVNINEKGEIGNDSVTWNVFNKRHGVGGSQGATVHQFGFGPRGGFMSSVPARPMWQFDQKDEDAGAKMIDQYVTRILRQHFGVD